MAKSVQRAEEAQSLQRVFSAPVCVASAILSALQAGQVGSAGREGKELRFRMTKRPPTLTPWWGAGPPVSAADLDVDLATFFLMGPVRNRQEELCMFK